MHFESLWPQEKRAATISAGVILAGVVFLCLPRVTGWTLEHLHKEDGLIFLSAFLKHGWGSLFQTYTGYLHVGPRLVTGVCSILPADMFASCIGISVALFRGMLAALALAVFMPYAKSWRWALAAATVLLFSGVGQLEVLGNVTNMRWFTDVAALLVLLGNFKKPGPAVVVSVLGVVAVWSDPLALILVPVAFWRALVLRRWGRLGPVAYILASPVHCLLINPAARSADWTGFANDPTSFFAQALIRGPIEAIIGQKGAQIALDIVGPQILLMGLLLPLVVVLLAWRGALPGTRTLSMIMIVAGMALVCATLIFAPLQVIALSVKGSIGLIPRYALLPATLVAQALLLLLPWAMDRKIVGKLAGSLMITLMIAATLADFKGDHWNAHGPVWAQTVVDARAECAGGDIISITVPVTPQGVPMQWTTTVTCDWLNK